MKRHVLSLVLVMIILFAFTACNGSIATPNTAEQTPTTASDNQANTPTDAEIEEVYQRAVDAFAWFDREAMPHDWEDYVLDEGEHFDWQYFRVLHDDINTLTDLEAHLNNIFTTDVVRGLFDMSPHQMYRDFDGVLRTTGGERGWRMDVVDEVHEIIRESGQRIIYRVTVDILDWDTLEEVVDTEVHEFVYELIDGQWLFSNFNLTR